MGFAIGVVSRNVILERKRIANITSAIANMDMMINLIIAQNISDVFPVVFDNHSWDCL
jgi:hypothetical protein